MEQLWLTVGSLSAELAGDQALAQELQEKPEGVTAEAFEGAMAALRDDLQEELGALRAVAQGASDSAALAAAALAALPPQDVGMGEDGGVADPPAPVLAPPAAGAPQVDLGQLRELILAELVKARRGPAYCRLPGSEVYHAVASAHPLDPPELHATWCNWPFGCIKGVTRHDTVPEGLCYRERVRGQGWVLRDVRPCEKCWKKKGEAVAPSAEGAE